MRKNREREASENLFQEESGTMETIQQITNAYESGVVGEQPEKVFMEDEENK
ncbi:hypothetical protein [Bacillus sp. FJAT-47783]|uniref:hypothetical protein n=1 Tax=Bacillus sp. FJAT-47783 TaxID=2922712 RepID=UPI001FADEC62|nr:hypothetical protein [Bacillus sp. FJAT-47783]